MTATARLVIERVRVRLRVDSDPDLSHLGEYSRTLKPGGIDRAERGDAGPRELRYFNPGAGDPDYIERDYARAERYNRGDWCMVGVYAEAEIVVNGRTQRVTSAGLWGIESDSGRDYFREVGREETAQLCADLAAMGFGKRAIRRAVAEMRERGDDDGSE